MESILATRMNAAPGGDSSIIRTHSRLASLPYTTNPTNPLWYSTDQGGHTLSNCDSNVWTHFAILCGSEQNNATTTFLSINHHNTTRPPEGSHKSKVHVLSRAKH